MIYFASMNKNPDSIKIGFTKNVDQRLRAIAAQTGGVTLIGKCGGDRKKEMAIHALFERDRIEGEWFKSSDRLVSYIRTFAACESRTVDAPKNANRFIGRVDQSEIDVEVARKMLLAISLQAGAEKTKAQHDEIIFEKLHELNTFWSRRRVRGIRAGDVCKMSLFEFVDLMKVGGGDSIKIFVDYVKDSGIDIAEWIAPEIRGE